MEQSFYPALLTEVKATDNKSMVFDLELKQGLPVEL
jgi:hypothetical protein